MVCAEKAANRTLELRLEQAGKRRKGEVFHGYGCPTCGENVGFNAKRCKSCGQSVAYSGAAVPAAEQQSAEEAATTKAPEAAAAAAFLASRRPKEAWGEPLTTRAQLTPIETARAAEILSHVNALRCEPVHRTLRQLVQRLMLHPLNQNWFNAPVDARALNLPDYHQLVARPMDLGTIKSRLATFEYADVEAFASDVRLVFQNATLYNPAGNAVHAAAVAMLADFEADLDKATDRARKQQARADEHECGLCQGKPCPLCGDKCLTFETPALLCSGPCGQRVRPGQYYHVTRDGSRLWCHKCFLGLKSVIPPPPELAPGPDAAFGAAVPAATNGGAAVGLWYKRDLVKRKFEEDVKEPWVQCDACARWVHQTCALFNPKTEADAGGGDASRFVCPLCELQHFAEAAGEGLLVQEVSETASSSDDDASSVVVVKREGDDDLASAERASLKTADEGQPRAAVKRPLRIKSLGPDALVLEEDIAERLAPPRPSLWAKPPDDKLVAVKRLGPATLELRLASEASWYAASSRAAAAADDRDDAADLAAQPAQPSSSQQQQQQQQRELWPPKPRALVSDDAAAVSRRKGKPPARAVDVVHPRLLRRKASIVVLRQYAARNASLSLCVIGYALAMALVADRLKLSHEAGALFAGLVLVGAPHVDKAERAVEPLTSLFGGMYIASLGLVASPKYLRAHALPLLARVSAVLALKLAVVAPLVYGLGFSRVAAAAAGLVFGQVSEVSLFVAARAHRLHLVERHTYLDVLSSTVVLLAIAPLSVHVVRKIDRKHFSTLEIRNDPVPDIPPAKRESLLSRPAFLAALLNCLVKTPLRCLACLVFTAKRRFQKKT